MEKIITRANRNFKKGQVIIIVKSDYQILEVVEEFDGDFYGMTNQATGEYFRLTPVDLIGNVEVL